MKNFLLSDNEKLIYELKPNKKRFIYIQVLFVCLSHIFVILLLSVIAIFFATSKQEDPNKQAIWPLILLIVIFVISCIVICISYHVRYKKRSYYVTNKRLIIASGFIGQDYKSLSLDTIMSQDVRVDFLDKLVKPNTGTIYFANPSAPVIYNSLNDKGRTSTFCFSNIDNPYDWFNKIKEVIDKNRKKR